MFQHLLMQFLDTKAPVLGTVVYPRTNGLYISLTRGRNLLTLMIRLWWFSNYLCNCMSCYHLVYDTVQYRWIVRVNYSTVVKVACI